MVTLACAVLLDRVEEQEERQGQEIERIRAGLLCRSVAFAWKARARRKAMLLKGNSKKKGKGKGSRTLDVRVNDHVVDLV